jgi:hypothetical protein
MIPQWIKDIAKGLIAFLQPIQQRRQALEKDDNYLAKVLEEGNRKAASVAASTLREIRQAMNLT